MPAAGSLALTVTWQPWVYHGVYEGAFQITGRKAPSPGLASMHTTCPATSRPRRCFTRKRTTDARKRRLCLTPEQKRARGVKISDQARKNRIFLPSVVLFPPPRPAPPARSPGEHDFRPSACPGIPWTHRTKARCYGIQRRGRNDDRQRGPRRAL
jgi:hypothetical protein